MTTLIAAQKSALEEACGSLLSTEQLLELEPFVLARNDVEIASRLPAKKLIQSRLIGVGTILATLAPRGGEFLNTLESLGQTDPNVKWVMKLIEADNFDVGMAVVRGMLTEYAEANPSLAPAIQALLALAVYEEPVELNTLSNLLNVAEGRVSFGSFVNG